MSSPSDRMSVAALVQPALELQGYGVSFGRRVILADVNLTLPATGVDVLMGPVYTGKSTLMRSLAGLNVHNTLFRSWGTARLLGRELSASWHPALVQQHATVLRGSVREALVHHARQNQERSSTYWAGFAADAAEKFQIAPRLQGGSLDAPMLSQSSQLQREINILSHALAAPPLLLIDEPTFGMDELSAMRLVDWLRMLSQHQRLVVALHHQGQARRLADRIILLGGGRVLSHAENPRFFVHPENEWADQFVRTGSLYIASPDAKPEDLGTDVQPPPPLPAAALAAIASFLVEEPVAVAAPAPVAAPVPVQSAAPVQAAAPVVAPKALDTPAAQHLPPPQDDIAASRRPAALPSISRDGVEAASMVGLVTMSEYRGPVGFHWIVPGKLAGCAEPGVSQAIDYDLDLLKTVGITHLITLTEKDLDQDALARNELKNLHLPIFDREAPSLSQAYMLVKRMQLLFEKGHVVAVHCKAGIGRTGTILACWLIREGGLSAQVAIQRLRAINKYYVQTDVQEQFLQEFEQDILRRL